MAGHKTTIMLRPEVWLRLRNRAERERVPVSTLVNDLLDEAMAAGAAGEPPASIGVGKSEIDDLGTNAHKHLQESIR